MNAKDDGREPSSDIVLSAGQREQLYQDIRGIVERRAAIEQSKGMLMFVYGIDADTALEMLDVPSRHHNLRLHLVSEQIAKDLALLGRPDSYLRRDLLDGLLLTVHQRIARTATR